MFAKTMSEKAGILACVAEEPQSVKTLAETLGCASNGHLSDSLAELVEAGFLSVDEGLNPSSAKEVREVRYRICDNYVRSRRLSAITVRPSAAGGDGQCGFDVRRAVCPQGEAQRGGRSSRLAAPDEEVGLRGRDQTP